MLPVSAQGLDIKWSSTEPPDTEPYVRWCGRTAEANPSASYPISHSTPQNHLAVACGGRQWTPVASRHHPHRRHSSLAVASGAWIALSDHQKVRFWTDFGPIFMEYSAITPALFPFCLRCPFSSLCPLLSAFFLSSHNDLSQYTQHRSHQQPSGDTEI